MVSSGSTPGICSRFANEDRNTDQDQSLSTHNIWIQFSNESMRRALIRSSQISRALRSVYTRRLLLIVVVAALGLEIVGLAEGFAASLGYPVSGAYPNIPSQFVAIASVAFPILPYVSLVMLAGALIFGVIDSARSKSETVPDSAQREETPTKFREYVLLAIAVSIAAFLVWLPRSLQSLPIGGDTLFYISVIDTMNREGPLWAVIYTDKPFFYLTVYGMQQLSQLSTLDFFDVLPVILAIGTTISAWFFVDSFYKTAAGYTALLTATSTSLMRTSIDLYASFFATILLFLTLGIYLRYRDSTRVRPILLVEAMLVLSLVSYWFVWGLLLVVLGVAEAMSRDRTKRVGSFLMIALPSMGVLGLFIAFALTHPPPSYWGLGSSFALYLGKAVTPAGTVTYSSATVDLTDLGLLQYNPVLPILAVVGLYFHRPKNFPVRTLYIWSSVMLAFSLVSTTGLHAALLIPLPVLGGLGLRKIVEMR